MLLLIFLALIWFNQYLTLKYVVGKPDLERCLELKPRDANGRVKKYKLCGSAYSSMNPWNPLNYIYLTVVLGEFLQFLAVIFHPTMPWLADGSTNDQEPTVDSLQNVLPEFLQGRSGVEVFLGTLIALTALYVVLMGEFVYSDRPPYEGAPPPPSSASSSSSPPPPPPPMSSSSSRGPP